MQNPIEDDEGGAHFEEAQGLGNFFHEIRHELLQAGGEGPSVRVEVGCQTQPKDFIECLECLLLVFVLEGIEDALEYVAHRTFRYAHEVDRL